MAMLLPRMKTAKDHTANFDMG